MKLLVYGTLRSFHHNHKAMGLHKALRFERTVRMPNMTMYHLGHYPGAVFEQDGYGVECELYEVVDPSIVQHLDRYEGYNQNNEAMSLFYRREVALLNGDVASIYLYNGEPNGQIIESGDFKEVMNG